MFVLISEETMDALKNIGLNLYERKVYVALLAKGIGSAGELAEMASVPRSRAYDVLESLSEKGFAIVQHSKPIKYVVVDPVRAIEKTKHMVKEDYSKNISRIEQLSRSDSLRELGKLYNTGVSVLEPSRMSGSFKGTDNINLQLGNMIKNAEDKLNILTTEEGLKDLFHNHAQLLSKASRKGVIINLIAPFSDSNVEEVKMLKKITNIKDINSLSHNKVPVGKMFCSDEREILFTLTDDDVVHDSQVVAFWTASDTFAQKFANPIFSLLWKNIEGC